MKLNLGSSDGRKEGYLSVDIAPPADVVYDLNGPWPWEDSSVDEICAHHIFEHLRGAWCPRQNRWLAGKIWAMNQAHRVLKPGGLLDLLVPSVVLGDGRVNTGAFSDPTHATFWTLDDERYYGERWNNPREERGRFGAAYGITALFRGQWILREHIDRGARRSVIIAQLTAIK